MPLIRYRQRTKPLAFLVFNPVYFPISCPRKHIFKIYSSVFISSQYLGQIMNCAIYQLLHSKICYLFQTIVTRVSLTLHQITSSLNLLSSLHQFYCFFFSTFYQYIFVTEINGRFLHAHNILYLNSSAPPHPALSLRFTYFSWNFNVHNVFLSYSCSCITHPPTFSFVHPLHFLLANNSARRKICCFRTGPFAEMNIKGHYYQ